MTTTTAEHIPGLWMQVRCPTCNGPVHLANPGGTNGRESKAIVRCPQHGHGEWLITCRITPMIERVGYQGPES